MAAHLASLGYSVEHHRFRFPSSALWAFPLLGAGLGWLGLVLVPLVAFPGAPPWAALAVWALGATSLGMLAFGVGAGTAPLHFPGRDNWMSQSSSRLTPESLLANPCCTELVFQLGS